MSAAHELSVTRLIAAPPETVYRTYTERMEEWFAPKPWTARVEAQDLRPGGASRTVMRSPEGQEHPGQGVYLEVVPNEKIVFTDAFTSDWVPQEAFMIVVVTFEPEGAGTRYTARVRHWNAEALQKHEAMGFHEGWAVVAGQLAALAEAEHAGDTQ